MSGTSNKTNKAGYCVTCLNCGKIHQRGYAADSTFICPKCGYENYVYLRYGVQIEMPASQMQSQQFLSRVRRFASSLDQMMKDGQEEMELEKTF